MRATQSVGRVFGLLLFVHLATGLTVPYVLLRPLTSSPGFLINAAGSSFQARLAVLLLFVGGAMTVGIAIASWRVFRQHNETLALWLLALAVVNLSLQAVENGAWLSMVSLSQEYARTGAADAGLFQSLAAVVGAAWRWVHYAHLLVVGSWIFVLYSLLYRSALVPRALSAVGLFTVMLHLAGITLPVFMGYRSMMMMGVPLGLSYLALTLWLIVKGFDESRRAVRAAAHEVELSGA
ncbi:MAG TPA: DUF4386 domain-containing protein [Pyrinomonadaceae bacterium]|nr:DUF4386 domain-containing protein [Pyrinomonadaceae bacterium]